MRYGLTQISEEEFEKLHTFVRACFDQGRQRFSPRLVTISTEAEWFPEEHRPYLADCSSLGVTMETREKHQEEFHIWITPQYTQPVFRFYMTLVHELVHGYAGLKYSHNAHWRRWFYRVMWHVISADIIPKPESSLEQVLFSVECSYNGGAQPYWQSGALDLVREASAKALSEHNVILDNYWKRLGCPA